MRNLVAIKALAALAVVAAAVGGCGGSSSGGGDGGNNGKLVLLAENGTNIRQAGLIKRFEQEHPEYKVELTEYPWQTAHDKLVAAFSSGQVPDVALAEDQWVGEFAKLGALAPLDDFKRRNGYQDSDFHPESWSYFVTDGHLYGAPAYTEARALFYRKDLFKQAGLSSPPRTFDEMMEMGRKLSDGQHHFGIADQTGDLDLHFFSWFLYSYGGDVYDKSRQKCALTSPQAMQALNFYKSLYDANVIPKDPAKRVETSQGFEEGYYAMAESGSWWFTLLKAEAPGSRSKWAAAPLPAGPGPISYGHPQPWIIPAKAANKPAAEAWIKFMLKPENAADWFVDGGGQIPPEKAAMKDSRLAKDRDLQAMVQAAEKGTNSVHNVPNGQAITLEIEKMLTAVKNGSATPSAAAASTCQSIDRDLQD